MLFGWPLTSTPLDKSTRLTADPETLRKRFATLNFTSDVASMLEVSHERLVWHIWKRPEGARYRTFRVKKRRGGYRTISAPTRGLKIIQHKMKQALDAMYEPGDSVHGFVRERSIVTNAAQHVGCRHVINIDLEDFFPSITFPRVFGMLQKWPCRLPREAATAVAAICFAGHEGLPQGAPTSPVIANMMCMLMDKHFAALARKYGFVYTRYCDDITFSTTRRRSVPLAMIEVVNGNATVGPAIQEILRRHGFKANAAKVRVRSRQTRQEVTGLVTNEKVNVTQRFTRQLRAMLHDCEKTSVAAAEERFRKTDPKHRVTSTPVSLIDVLIGKLSFLAMVRGRDNALVKRLVYRARKIDDAFCRVLVREDAVLVLERHVGAAMLDGIASQGTGFFLEGIGLVTASHVVCDDKDKPLSWMQGFRSELHTDRKRTSVIVNDPKQDIAVLDGDFPELPRLRAGNSDAVRRGDKLVIHGFPHWSPGSPQRVTSVEVMGESPKQDYPRFLVSFPISGGNSGGPVLNARGEVVGVVVTGDDSGKAQFPNAFVPIRKVLEAVERQRAAAKAEEDSKQASSAVPAAAEESASA